VAAPQPPPPPPAPVAPPQPTTILKLSGSGNAVTPAFAVPSAGEYEVVWSYSGNRDEFGPSNFIIDNTGDGLGMGLANDIAASGHGSTEVVDADGQDRLTVQSEGQWSVTVLNNG
jgi:hypothetical protein